MTMHSKLIQTLSEAYSLKILGTRLLYNGVNKIFKIDTDKKQLFFKIFKKTLRTSEEINYERKLLIYLSWNGISCSRPIEPPSHQESIFPYNGLEYYGILMHEDIGKTIDNDTDPSQIFNFGGALSRLHKVKLPDFSSSSCALTDTSELIKSLNDPSFKPQCNLLPLIIDLYESLDTLLPSKENPAQTSICHGDAWPGNAIFNNGSCTLIDFERSQPSLPIFDVATFLWWALGHKDRDYALLLWTQFKQGYGTDINEILKNDISTLIKLNELRSLVFLYKNAALSEKALAHVTNRTKWFTTDLKPNLVEREIWKLA